VPPLQPRPDPFDAEGFTQGLPALTGQTPVLAYLFGERGSEGVTATWGGIELAGWPAGDAPGLQVPLSVLEHTPFRDFFVPGLLLLCFVGISNLLVDCPRNLST
jgi:hypothetical protein